MDFSLPNVKGLTFMPLTHDGKESDKDPTMKLTPLASGFCQVSHIVVL
jgi:hypothetical protein